MGALAAGRAGLGAVGAGYSLPRRDRLVRSPAAPGRQAGVGPAERQRHPLRVGGLERDDGRGGVGRPPPSASGGLAAAGTGAVGGGRRRRRRVRRLRRGGQARGVAGRPRGGRVRRYRHAHGAGVHRLCAAAHADRVVALSPLAVVGAHRCGRAHGVAGLEGVAAPTVAPAVPVGPQSVRRPRPGRPADGRLGVASIVTSLGLVVAAASLVVRFRRAGGMERQQLRWVALTAGLSTLAVPVAVAGQVLGNNTMVTWAGGAWVAILPMAVGAAIARYRLYDLDRIISRTLAYGLLTLLLGGGYAGVVLGLGQLVGRGSSLLVAGATLAVAGVFQPARRRVQAAVDRRFNRRRYNAARTIATFSARLREEIDLEALTAELLTVVEQTMQPAQAALWLRPSVIVFPDQRSTGPSRAASQPTTAPPSVRAAL